MVFVFGMNIPLIELVFVFMITLFILLIIMLFLLFRQITFNKQLYNLIKKENLELQKLRKITGYEKEEIDELNEIKDSMDDLILKGTKNPDYTEIKDPEEAKKFMDKVMRIVRNKKTSKDKLKGFVHVLREFLNSKESKSNTSTQKIPKKKSRKNK